MLLPAAQLLDAHAALRCEAAAHSAAQMELLSEVRAALEAGGLDPEAVDAATTDR